MVPGTQLYWLESSDFSPQTSQHPLGSTTEFLEHHGFHLGEEEWQPGQHKIADLLVGLKRERKRGIRYVIFKSIS